MLLLERAEWVFAFNGQEYRSLTGQGHTAGVTAFTRAPDAGTWTPASIQVRSVSKNTYVAVP